MSQERDHNHDRDQENHGHHDHREHHKRMALDFKRRFWISLALTLPILALAPMIGRFLGWRQSLSFAGDEFVLFALSAVVFAYGGFPFLKGLVEEIKKKAPGMMTLVSLAITVAFVYSSLVVFGLPGKTFFWESATLVVVMLLGHWIEMRSVLGASKALEELTKLLPSTAHRLGDDNETEDVPVSELKSNDRVLVRPGERVPVDGVVTKGSSSVDEAMVTGESRPVTKETEDEVIGGSVNGDGSLTIEVTKAGEDSYLTQVIKMVREAQSGKSRSERIADRAAFWLTIIAVGGGAITLVLWLTLANREFAFALERMVTVMVIACPHALGLAIPLVVAASTTMAAKAGLLIRQRGPFERARAIDTVVFDKTGTLTTGEFEVSDVALFNDQAKKEDVLTLAAGVESESEHSIARAIVSASTNGHGGVEGFRAIPGKGAEGRIDGKDVKVVSPGYLSDNNIDFDESRRADLQSKGDTVVYVLVDGVLTAAIGLRDTIRDESGEAVNRLRERGFETLLITGDSEEVARYVAGELGIDDFFAGVLPDKKAERIKELQSKGKQVAMVGDGVNDAPALAQANIGVAIGAGTDVALETADVVLVNSDPGDVVHLFDHARATHRKTIQNLAWATGYNVIAIPLAAGVLFHWNILLNPAVGALLMSLSTVIVAINARFIKIPGSA